MIGNIRNFIVRIRNKNENVKKRWLIILSGSTMFLVLFLWVIFFQITLPTVASPSQQQNEEISVKPEGQLTHIKKTLAAGFGIIMEKINLKNSITLKAPERNFILDELEKIPVTSLP